MRKHTRTRALATAVLGVALLASTTGSAQAAPARDLTFMSYNLYLGSSLDPALEVATLPAAEQPAALRRRLHAAAQQRGDELGAPGVPPEEDGQRRHGDRQPLDLHSAEHGRVPGHVASRAA